MEKIKERGKIYALHKASDKLKGYYGSAMLSVVQFDGYDIQCAYIDGYLYTKQELEVKEVDLEKEYEEFVVDDPIFGNFITNDTMGMKLAKHFFELGLKAQKL